jgi:REP element-mobilizing transposase RayT
MARRPRYDIEGGIHHVMNRGVNREPTFFADVDRRQFGQRLADIHEQFGVETLAYCLMDNHYHLLLRARTGGLSRAMHHLGLVYTRRTNDRLGRDGPLFRGRYHSIPVTTDAYLMRAARYVHRNVLDLPGVRSPADYRWSSYRAYVGLRPAAGFLNLEIVLDLFGGDSRRLEAATCDDSVDALLPCASVEDIVQLVRLAIATDDIAHGVDHEIPRWVEHTALILVADRLQGHPLHASLDARLGFPTPAARRMALKRARDRASDRSIASIVDTVMDALAPPRRAA